MVQSPQLQFGPTILQRLWEVNKGNDLRGEGSGALPSVASVFSMLVNWARKKCLQIFFPVPVDFSVPVSSSI